MSKLNRNTKQASASKENKPPRSIDQEDASTPMESGWQSERRRYRILRALKKKGIVTIAALKADRSFQETIGDVQDSTLQEDFRQIEQLVGQFYTVVRDGASTLLRVPMERSDEPKAADPDLEAKRRIGRRVIELLGNNEVLYLSTGTTVEQTARALLDGEKRNVSVVLTDNFKVTDLFRQRALHDSRLQSGELSLIVLGGAADLGKDDIKQEPDVRELKQWQCTTAVVSATAIDPISGKIFSFRQPDLKKKIFKELLAPKVIIPVLASKISKNTGGRGIYDPKEDRVPGEHRQYFIVSTDLDHNIRVLLEKHGYDVRMTSEDDGKALD